VRTVLIVSETVLQLQHTTLRNLTLFYQKEGKIIKPNHIALIG